MVEIPARVNGRNTFGLIKTDRTLAHSYLVRGSPKIGMQVLTCVLWKTQIILSVNAQIAMKGITKDITEGIHIISSMRCWTAQIPHILSVN